jgi:drug/metabolite transporter (DMT)-like permease
MPFLPIEITLFSAVIHASWNLLARKHRETDFLFNSSILVGLVALIPVLAYDYFVQPFPAKVWFFIPFSGTFLAFYYLGLTRGYRSGDFTVVYPVARALPVLIIALSDVVLGSSPTPFGWLGIFLVTLGVMVSPLESLRGFSLNRYRNRTMVWVLLAVIGITGYTIIDGLAADFVQPGPVSALRYFVLQTSSSVIVYWFLLTLMHTPVDLLEIRTSWRRPALLAFLIASAYTLVLWAYQLSSETSYVVAVRQFSIVVGVVAASYLFKETAPRLRIAAAVTIMIGICLIVLTG